MGHAPPRQPSGPPPFAVVVASWVLRLGGIATCVEQFVVGHDPVLMVAAMGMMGVGVSLSMIEGEAKPIERPTRPPPRPPQTRLVPIQRTFAVGSKPYYLELAEALWQREDNDFDGTDLLIARIHVECGGKLTDDGMPDWPKPKPKLDPAAQVKRLLYDSVTGRREARPKVVPRDFADQVRKAVAAGTEYPCPQCAGRPRRGLICKRCSGVGFVRDMAPDEAMFPLPMMDDDEPAYPTLPTTRIGE